MALATEEMLTQENLGLQQINAETEAAVEIARQTVLANLMDLHTKESVRLEEDLKYQQQMQRTNLANRLDRQKKLREKELLVQAHAAAMHSPDTVTAAAAAAVVVSGTEENASNNPPRTPRTPRSPRFSTSSTSISTSISTSASFPPAASALEQSIQAQVAAEMKIIAEQEEAILQQSLDALKATHDKESGELQEELQYKKSSADKRLRDRLAAKTAKQQADNAAAAAAAAAVAASVKTDTLSSFAVDNNSNQLAPTATDGNHILATAAGAPPLAPIIHDGSLTAEAYTLQVKARQKATLDRLTQFVTGEKTLTITEKQRVVQAANSKQKKEAALNDLAHTSILFDHLVEFLSLGLKKTFLYQTKDVKDLHAQLKAECAIGECVRISVEQMAQLESPANISVHRISACEKILERFQRDIGALMDSQALERRTSLAKMKQNGSSQTQLQSAR